MLRDHDSRRTIRTQTGRRAWFAAGVVLFLLGSLSSMFGQTPATVTIDAIPLGDGVRAKFNVFKPVPANDPKTPPQFTFQTQDGEYLLGVDPSSVRTNDEFNYHFFDLFLKRQTDQPNEQWYRYQVRAEADGKFQDAIVSIDLKIGLKDQPQSGATIKVPFFCGQYQGGIVLGDPSLSDKSLLQVSLYDPASPVVDIKNVLGTLPIKITHVRVSSEGCNDCWMEQKSTASELTVQPSSFERISLLQPRPLKAMFKRAFVLKSDEPQDVLAVAVAYTIDSDGDARERTTSFKVRVRFKPSPYSLVLAVILGSAIGVGLRRLLDPKTTKLTWQFAAKSLVFAGVAEFFAVVAASYDSKLVLFNFNFDPRQFIPAVVLALVVTGGQPVVKWLLELPFWSKSMGGGGRGGPEGDATADATVEADKKEAAAGAGGSKGEKR